MQKTTKKDQGSGAGRWQARQAVGRTDNSTNTVHADTQTHTYLLPSSLFSRHTRQALFTEHPNMPTGWLGPRGTADISGPIPAYVVSDLRDNYHTILNNHVFNVSQKKLVLYY